MSINTMDKLLPQIKKYLSNTKVTEAEDIVCDTIQIKEISKEAKEEMEKYVNVNLLCFNSCQLKSLNNLPNLPLLEEIQLSDNHITGIELTKLLIYPHLMTLKICNNLIEKIDDLKPLVKLTELSYLDLSECPVTKSTNYRTKVFEMIPHLQYLDLVDKNGNNYSDVEEEDGDEEDEEYDDKENEDFIVKDDEEDNKEGDVKNNKPDDNEDEDDDNEAGEEEGEDDDDEEGDEDEDEEDDKDKDNGPIKKPKH